MARQRSWITEYLLIRELDTGHEAYATEALGQVLQRISDMPDVITPESASATNSAIGRAVDALHALAIHYVIELRNAGWNRLDIANALDTSPNQISKWEAEIIKNASDFDSKAIRLSRKERELLAEETAASIADEDVLDSPFPSGLPRRWELPV